MFKLDYFFTKKFLFKFLIFLLIATAIFFRYYDYYDRIVILNDNSRDAQVARYAFDEQKIPIIGQFSSAGPFFYGPWYYWLLILFSAVPLGLLSPWYLMSLFSLVFILLVFWIGKEAGGINVAVLAAFFAAISPAQISNSLSIWNPAIVPLLSAIILIFAIRYLDNKSPKAIFFFGFFLMLAITIHFQNILLIPTVLILPFFAKIPKKHFLYLFSGLIVPLIPLIYFDINNYWYNFKSLLIYLLIDQYSIYVPNRWLTYVFSYWPETWGKIIGGNIFAGYGIISLICLVTVLSIRNIRTYKTYYFVTFSFILEIIFYRYYRGPRFEYYSLFSHPSVLIISAWSLNKLIKINKFVGFAAIIIVAVLTLNQSLAAVKGTQISLTRINNLKKEVYSAFPGKNFDVHNCPSQGGAVSHPLALSMYLDKRNESGGIPIVACELDSEITWHLLQNIKVAKDEQIYSLTTSKVYEDTVEWYKTKPPTKDENFWNFLKTRLNPKCYPRCK